MSVQETIRGLTQGAFAAARANGDNVRTAAVSHL